MPKRPSRGVVQKIVELPTALAEEVAGFVAARGSTFRAEVMRALRRHMDSPPPMPAPAPPDPPLPAGEPCAPPKRPRGRPKKNPENTAG